MSVALVEQLARCFWMGDREGAMALLHPQVRIQQPGSLPHGGWYDGHDGVEKMGAVFARHWDRTITDPRPSWRPGPARPPATAPSGPSP